MSKKAPGGHRNPKGKTHGTTSAHRRLLARLKKLEARVNQLEANTGIE